ncbi:hypothetical protein [Fischerella sp. NIES-3754]|uniref:hypothetical protein n=1 Tax=Fischerella sp. NIES-3754 TaxID=1752063 RepID=UPI0007218FC1|nr:hypothetical protein [Fischerella sp. NIES-3754]BAU08530.1 hypothetical protein FIS3754_44780 [Fischerella sp. NIES-3754]BCX10908.1 MAG: hypothetical protein KatS3mg066_4767 [Fischerella sp.]
MTNITTAQLQSNNQIPTDVQVRSEARKPITEPTLGIPVHVNRQGTPQHRLVTIGDSITHGFQSGAIFNTRLSYPAIIAREMGWKQLRYPNYDSPGDGLPLNLESLARNLQQKFGDNVNFLEFLPALLFLRSFLDKTEDYWERGEGSLPVNQREINHNLAVYGWDLRNTLSRNADICIDIINNYKTQDDFWQQTVAHHNERATIRVLNSARDANGKALTPLQAATALGAEGTAETEGIETLIVFIGANNALGSILTFNVVWTDTGYDDMKVNDQYTVWRPIHFKAELDQVVAEVKKIRARHVIFGTVPHITIVPFAKGVSGKVTQGSRYFPYYTLPWIADADFNPKKHPHLTEAEVRAIDSAIDQYNEYITDAVRQARNEGRDWYLLETCGLLDRLAFRRYLEDNTARPSWWEEVGGAYELPPALQALSPVPDSRFFISGSNGRTQGGLFSLDGIHPTTIGYGILAQEVIKIMQSAGVKFYESDGQTERRGEVKVDFQRLVSEDTLISQPPRNVADILKIIGELDKRFNIVSHLLKRNY